MFLDRYSRRRRWIVGCIAVSVAVVVMLLTPPPRVACNFHLLTNTGTFTILMKTSSKRSKRRDPHPCDTDIVHLFFNENVYETRRSYENNAGLEDTTVPTTESKETPTIAIKPSRPPSLPLPTPSIFTYVEEPPTEREMKRLMRALSTQGAVCSDVRRIGGLPIGPHGAPRPYGPDGMWYVCFDEEVNLHPGSCVVYSVGTGDDFSFDEKMEDYGCNVFAFDPTMGKEDHNHSARVMFYNLGLSDVNQERAENDSDKFGKDAWKTRTLATIIKELGHSEREIDILKMDIESDEWKCLRNMLADGTLKRHVRQLNVEYHVIMNTPEALRQYYSIARWLERQGFRIFHSRRNPYCPQCIPILKEESLEGLGGDCSSTVDPKRIVKLQNFGILRNVLGRIIFENSDTLQQDKKFTPLAG